MPFPATITLGEALLLKAAGGAVAVWAPSGASPNSPSAALAEQFFKVAFQGQQKILGRALLKTMAYFANGGGHRYVLDIYNLLGDPALEVK